jgi:hypothetical protein
MKKNKFLQGPVLPIAAVALLAMSVVGSTRAVFTTQTNGITTALQTATLSVALLENGEEVTTDEKSAGETAVEEGQLLSTLLGEDESFQIGKNYEEGISAKNDGDYPEYVRVIITKSWKNSDGTKNTTLDPDLIKLTTVGEEDWIKVESNTENKEQTVYYYTKQLEPDETVPLVTEIQVDNSVTSLVTTEGTSGTITTTYDYDGKSFSIEAEVDAVQTHSAEAAILGAWGVKVSVDENGILSFANAESEGGADNEE